MKKRRVSKASLLVLALAALVVVAMRILDHGGAREGTPPRVVQPITDGHLDRHLGLVEAPGELPTEQPIELPLVQSDMPVAASSDDLHPAFASLPDEGTVPLTITGRAVDEAGLPIAGAEMFFRPDLSTREALGFPEPRCADSGYVRALHQCVSTRAGDDGRFSLRTRRVVAEMASLPADRPTVFITMAAEGFGALGDWHHLGPRHVLDLTDVVLQRSATVTGHVVDGRGAPVAGARVVALTKHRIDDNLGHRSHASVPEFLRAALSDDRGDFRIETVWPGVAKLTVRHPTLATTTVEDVQLAREALVDLGSVVMNDGWRLSGRVVGRDGSPVPGARIVCPPKVSMILGQAALNYTLRRAEEGGSAPTALSRADGRFDLPHLTGESTTVVAGAEGFRPVLLPEVPFGTTDLLVTLVREGRVQVRVTDRATGKPLVPTSVDAVPRSSPENIPGRPGGPRSHGGFNPDRKWLAAHPTANPAVWEILGTGAEGVVLWVEAPGYATERFIVDGRPAPERLSTTVSLGAGSVVHGRVTNSAGAALAGATVLISPGRNPPPPRQTTVRAITDADGQYRATGLGAGKYSIKAERKGHIPAWELVDVESGETVRVDLVASVAGRVVIHVQDAAGAPYSPPSVEHQERGWATDRLIALTQAGSVLGTKHATWTEPGVFVAEEVRAGHYEVLAEPGARGHVDVAGGETAELHLTLRRWPVVRGVVLDHGEPVPGVRVSCSKTQAPIDVTESAFFSLYSSLAFQPEMPPTVETDALGRYELEVDGVGAYVISAVRASTSLSLAYDREVVAHLHLDSGRISGIVVDAEDGQPIPGASVVASSGSGNAVTGEDGHFLLPRASPGEVRLSVTATDRVGPARQTVVVHPGVTNEVRFEFVRGARLEVSVRTASGTPIPSDLRLLLRQAGSTRTIAHLELEDGLASTSGLATGDYGIRLSRGGKLIEVLALHVPDTRPIAMHITVPPADE